MTSEQCSTARLNIEGALTKFDEALREKRLPELGDILEYAQGQSQEMQDGCGADTRELDLYLRKLMSLLPSIKKRETTVPVQIVALQAREALRRL